MLGEIRRYFAATAQFAALFFLTAVPAAAAGYVGAELADLKPEARVVISSPQPIQILYQFTTKGAPNNAATKFTKAEVLSTVKASGLFSDVSEAPAPNGAILSVTIDNTVAPGAANDAAAKGVVTGATLFIVGSNARDYYHSTIEYVSGPKAAKIVRTADHSIVFQMGLVNSAPTDAVRVEGGLKGAILTMTRQIVSNPLNALASDPAFAPNPVVDTSPPVPTVAAPEPAETTTSAAPAIP